MTKWRNVILTLTIVGMVGSVSASTAAQQANNPTVLDTAIALNQQGRLSGPIRYVNSCSAKCGYVCGRYAK